MNETLLQRVKNSLTSKHYVMNDSWLSDCVEFYLDEHQNSTQEEIITFVMLQWGFNDLRAISNEKGCLPRNLASQKFTTLQGKYILQVDKMYDISTSKYKQIEKIRNVSSENIEATEHENKTQEFQTWEPKSKRMLQLFMTDGVQEISAIEYKTIRFLKELYPGYKLLIKGPVICRKGVLLLEENNIAKAADGTIQVGGEVDSMLIPNALENVLARALNLEENPDPYNDKTRPKQNTESTQQTATIDDDFDIDSEALEQIDKQVQQQNTNASKNSVTPSLSNKQSASSVMDEFNYSYQAPSVSSKTQKSNASSAKNLSSIFGSTSSNQKKQNNDKMVVDFDDEGDSFLEMVDDSEFKTPSVSKVPIAKSKVVSAKETKSIDDDFPDDDEIYDLTESPSPKPKSQPTTTKPTLQQKYPSGIVTSSPKSVSNEKRLDIERGSNTSKANWKENHSIASSYKSTSKVLSKNKETYVATPSVSDIDQFYDDLDFNNMDLDQFDDDFDKDSKTNLKNTKSSQASSSNSPKGKIKNTMSSHTPMESNTNSTDFSGATNYDNEFDQDMFNDFKNKLMGEQKSSQSIAKSASTSKNADSISVRTPSEINKTASVKLSDKLRLENKNTDYFITHNKALEKSSRSNQTSSSSLFKSKNTDTGHSTLKSNKSSPSKTKSESKCTYENLDQDFQDEFDVEFEARMEIDNKPVVQKKEKKSQDPLDNYSDTKSTTSSKRYREDTASPSTSSRQKVRCVESTPKDKTSSRKITDFFNKPKPQLLTVMPLYEAICDVLENLQKQDEILTVVRGKVVNVVKLNLLKGEQGSYFHLEGTISDGTGNLDVVFSSEVLEEIVGYSTQDFILKRKRAKADPRIKNEMRDDLVKAQQIIKTLDALMEIKVKKNEKTLIIGIRPLTKEEKKSADERLARYKVEKK